MATLGTPTRTRAKVRHEKLFAELARTVPMVLVSRLS